MAKALARLTLVGLFSLLMTGCFVAVYGRSVVATVVPRGRLPTRGPPTPYVPAIHLRSAGTVVRGVLANINWHAGGSGSGESLWSGPWPPTFPATLSARVGQSVDIVITYNTPAAVLWLTELDGRGIPTASLALTSPASITAYSLSRSGQYTLQVMAQWSYENYVAYLFALDVQP